jgi:uncharacterized protein (DUF4415 family)
MRKEYDFSKAVPNPYASKLKKQITIRLDESVIEYFKKLAGEFDMPYQNLINLYLRECSAEHKRPHLQWLGREQLAGIDARLRSRKSA